MALRHRLERLRRADILHRPNFEVASRSLGIVCKPTRSISAACVGIQPWPPTLEQYMEESGQRPSGVDVG